jgi:hypothetical protein
MEARNIGLILFGMTLLVIGLYASFYENKYYSNYDQRWISYSPPQLPYQGVGIILIIAGITLSAVGLFYPSRKTLPPPIPSEPPKGFFKKCIKCGAPMPLASETCSFCGANQNQG